MTGMEPQFIHCCYNNCIAFTGDYAERAECPHCGEDRYVDGNQARKTFVYIPLTRNTVRAKALVEYRKNLLERAQAAGQDELADVFHGQLYNDFHVKKLGLFQDPHDIALHMSLDGVQLTNMRHHEVTPVIPMNPPFPAVFLPTLCTWCYRISHQPSTSCGAVRRQTRQPQLRRATIPP
jgi:hypothetical protein